MLISSFAKKWNNLFSDPKLYMNLLYTPICLCFYGIVICPGERYMYYCPNFRTTNSKVWTVLSTDDIVIIIHNCPNLRTHELQVWTV